MVLPVGVADYVMASVKQETVSGQKWFRVIEKHGSGMGVETQKRKAMRLQILQCSSCSGTHLSSSSDCG